MAHRVADKVTLATIVELSFQGADPSKIATDLKLSQRLVNQTLERLEATMLLVAHELPVQFFGKVMRVNEEEARVYLDLVRKHLGKNERVREYLAAKKAVEPVDSVKAPKEAKSTATEEGPGDEAVLALEVLDFWTSKWL